MRSQITFAIHFWADHNSANNEGVLIYARITANKKRVNLSLKRRTNPKLWDPKQKRLKGNSKEARAFNQYLDEVYTQLFQIYQDLKYQGHLITPQLIKARYNGEDHRTKSLQDLLTYHTSKTKNTLAPGTIKNFAVTETTSIDFYKIRKRQLIYI